MWKKEGKKSGEINKEEKKSVMKPFIEVGYEIIQLGAQEIKREMNMKKDIRL